jgi:hypothetical protein
MRAQRVLSIFVLPMILLVFSFSCEASEDQPPPIGNFYLSTSQEPGPLVGFGQNIVDKYETQLFLFADNYIGVNKHFIDVIPGVVYGLTENLSLFVNVPYAASYKQGKQRSNGFEDAFAQLEYVYLDTATKTHTDQATIVANMTVPTGSIHKDPETGNGSPTVFLGTTYNRTYVDWFAFVSPGVILTTARNGTKFGNSYLYQLGVGRHIANINGWLLAWMAEADGTYSQRNRVLGVIDHNTGGNVVYVTPSIWASTKKLIFQFGVGFPVTQNLFGNQTRDTLLIVGNIGWTFS